MNQQPKIKRRIGKFEVGRTIGEGTFAKVKFARNVETGDPVALKILDKDKVLKHKLAEQIKREIATMKLIKHPNVVRLFEVMGSKTKIYIAMEFVTGGELFDKIVNNGRMRENEARKYFQQLINAVDYCHSRGVYHRDLKPENLLLDAAGNLKVSDFGLSALSQQVRDDGLFHTACGTPNYVAPEVLNDRGYDGATADLWSCGVILFVLLAGYLPFDDSNVMILYKKISSAEFTCPPWMSHEARKLICRILDPNTMTRYTVADILEDKWFKKDYKPAVFNEKEYTNLDDVEAVFTDSAEYHVTERKEEKPTAMNAFELISMSKGLNLGNLFDEGFKRETRFTSRCPANEIINKIEEAAKPLGFDVQTKNYKMKLENVKAGRKGNLNVATEVFQVAPSLHMVEVRKAKGDTLEFHKGRMGTDEEAKTMAGKHQTRKRIQPREAADYNDSNHLRKARKINGITMMNWKPSYCLEHAVTAVGSFQLGCESLRAQHRQKLRRLLKTLMLQHNWIGASGVLSVLLKGTIREKSLSRNQHKYWATLELLKKIKGDNLTPYKVQKVYDLWMKKSGSMKGRPTQGRLAVQLESMLFSLRHKNTKDTEMDAVDSLKQEQGFEGNSIANLLVGLAYFQLWYSTIPEEFQLEDLNRSSTPVQSHLSESRTYTPIENSDGPRTHMSSENSDGPRTHMSSENSFGHDAVDSERRDLSLVCHSSTSVGNEKDNVYAEHDPKVCTEVNVELQKGSFQDTDCAEGSGNEKSFHTDKIDDIPDASIFYIRGLPPWLLPIQLPQSTENMEEVIYSHKNMLNGHYKDALMHLRAALHLEPPVFEALHPLIQMLLLGDHVMEALNELESVSHKLDTSLYIRLKASVLEYFDHGNNLQLCTHFEDILKKDPTCSHTLAKLISMHQDGVYSTEELVEMIGLHLDAVIVGDCSTWKEMACCFYKLSYCERVEISTCYTQDDEVDGPTKSNAKHDDVVIKRIPAIFTNSRTKHTWQLRCRWWITRHFSHKRLALDIASDDMELVTYKAAIATNLYGREVMYSVKATQHLTKENKMDMLAILQMHCVDASSGFFCSSLHKEI